MTAAAPESTLVVQGLTVRIGAQTILDGVSFSVPAGGRLGIIGASGSGKSMTALALMGLEPEQAHVSGSIRIDGTELIGLSDRDRATYRGSRIGMVFQEPATALDPLRRVGAQIAEPLRLHRGLDRRNAGTEAIALADAVGLPKPSELVRRYPHQLSGGQRQRISIAMAIAGNPSFLIADEPTTALDVTTQSHILDLFAKTVDERGTGLVFITHDLSVLARIADTVIVLDAGRVVETGTVSDLLSRPGHPATARLVDASRSTARRPR